MAHRKNSSYKRPPLPSIHMISRKYDNKSGQTYEFLKRNTDRKVIHEKTPSEPRKRTADKVVDSEEWRSFLKDDKLSTRQRHEKMQTIAKKIEKTALRKEKRLHS